VNRLIAYQPHILIVAAGIIGTWIAWHLAQAGARVTVMNAAYTWPLDGRAGSRGG